VDRIAAGGALGEAARGLIRRLVEEYPGPVEDIQLACIIDDDGAPWSVEAIVSRARHARSRSEAKPGGAKAGQFSSP
jgi:hypothetical protein